MNAMPPPLPAAPRRGWWQRHWRWAVPLLCLFGAAAFAGFVALLMFAVIEGMRSSDTYATAMQRAREHPQVTAALGTPIEPGWYLSGRMSESGTSGQASLQIPISGPEGAADLYVEAEKTAGRWTYSTLMVDVDGRGEPIDLLAPADAATEPATP